MAAHIYRVLLLIGHLHASRYLCNDSLLLRADQCTRLGCTLVALGFAFGHRSVVVPPAKPS
jgi:hypothetical protein